MVGRSWKSHGEYEQWSVHRLAIGSNDTMFWLVDQMTAFCFSEDQWKLTSGRAWHSKNRYRYSIGMEEGIEIKKSFKRMKILRIQQLTENHGE